MLSKLPAKLAHRSWQSGDSSAESSEGGFSTYCDPVYAFICLQKVVADRLICRRKRDVESFLSIVENSERVTLKGEEVEVLVQIGAEGWAMIAVACIHQA